MKGRIVCVAACVWLSGAAAGVGPAARAAEQEAQAPYLGLSVRDTTHGPVVGWVFPGPLGGQGFVSVSGLRRGDNIVAAWIGPAEGGGERVEIASAAAFNEFAATLAVGQSITIEARRSPEAVHDGAEPRGGPGGEHTRYEVVVASRRAWTGTVGRGLAGREIAEPEEGEFEGLLLGLAEEVGAREAEGGLDDLLAMLTRVQEDALDPNSVPPVVRSFRRPLSADAVAAGLTALAHEAADGSGVRALAVDALGLPAHDPEALRRATEGWDRAQTLDDLRGLVAWQRTNISVGGAGAEAQIRGINATEGRIGPHLASLLAEQETLEHWARIGEAHTDAAPVADPGAGLSAEAAATLAEAVRGEILHVEVFEDGSLGVVGGRGPNRYDMGLISRVYDVGGNDEYVFGAPRGATAGSGYHVIDLGGDDVYESVESFAGPGVGVLGLSVVDDRGGNDVYRGDGAMCIGAGLLGVGLIIDHAGDDRYENRGPESGWSVGVGYYGVGLVIDRSGDDVYLGEQLGQGVGGPRGLGAIIDSAGHDRYELSGTNFPSVYATPGVTKAFGQGFGFGVRSYAAGGVGAVWDLAGNDRYEAGEFAQGCAYYFALGLVHDRAGNDIYIGNRYGQGSAAHQAVGLLIDEAGNDRYWSMTAASQAGVWDQSIAMLIDRAGDDRYSADGLAQGSASMQALGVLLDLGGRDAYLARGGATQGQGGGNSYHYDALGVFSFSALIDLGGGEDLYSSGRPNGATLGTGTRNESAPGNSSLYGVFSDR